MTIKTSIYLHRSRVSLAWFLFYWWRHTRLLMTSQWPDNYDAITWIVICSSLDIDFILGDIHRRSCKNIKFSDYIDCYRDFVSILFIWITRLGFLQLSTYGYTNVHLPGCFRPWTLPLNIGLDMLPLESLLLCLDSLQGYPTGEFQVLQILVLVVFGAVD